MHSLLGISSPIIGLKKDIKYQITEELKIIKAESPKGLIMKVVIYGFQSHLNNIYYIDWLQKHLYRTQKINTKLIILTETKKMRVQII